MEFFKDTKKSSKQNKRKQTPYNILSTITENEKSLTSEHDSTPESSKNKTSESPKKKTHESSKKKTPESPKNKTPESPKKKTPESPKNKSSTPESILIKVKSKSPEKAVEDIELKFPEPLPDKITYDKKIAKRMNQLFDKRNKLKTFEGNDYFITLFYLYLFKKYKTTCTIKERGRDAPDIIIHVYKNEHDELNDLLRKNFIEQMVKCIKKDDPFIIIPLNLEIERDLKNTAHENLLIYRSNTRELEHFEPHGFQYMGADPDRVNRVVNKFLSLSVDGINAQLNKSGLPDIKLIKASEVCPSSRSGVQYREENSTLPRGAIEPNGYCAAWSMFFAEMCLKNPEIPSRQINDAILNENLLHNDNYLRRVIRGYTSLINNKMAKYFSEIFDEEITSEKLINYNQQKEVTDQYINFRNNISAIMQKEINPASRPKSVAAKKYSKFNKTIKIDTSSSELSEGEKEKRKNKTKTSKPRNTKTKTAKTKTETAFKALTKMYIKKPKSKTKVKKESKVKSAKLLKTGLSTLPKKTEAEEL